MNAGTGSTMASPMEPVIAAQHKYGARACRPVHITGCSRVVEFCDRGRSGELHHPGSQAAPIRLTPSLRGLWQLVHNKFRPQMGHSLQCPERKHCNHHAFNVVVNAIYTYYSNASVNLR